ncbi:MAG: NAD-dependent malic enzyme [Anaerofustis stercorihominis]|nr:NAD-dependent malic enzyme [Anaerofustis stercorihominis]
MDYYKESLRLHEENKGKVTVQSKVAVENKDDLSIAYTPGVAQPCVEIAKNKEDVYRYTAKGNLVAVVSDGSAVLGLGNIGAHASMPVMEGKCVLFKTFADVDAFPICVDTQDTEEIIKTVANIAPVFGGINLEDISAPRCFEIERRLNEMLDIPVFHDDQHGTAIVAAAAVLNALKITGKDIEKVKAVICGAGAAGTAVTKMFLSLGMKNIIVCDIDGVIYRGRELKDDNLKELADITNPENITGTVKDAVVGADIFLGVSAPNLLTKEDIAKMNEKSVVMPMANPTPEIMPDEAKEGGAYIIGTGRSDYPNQINNVLAFPGIFRGALDARAKSITEEMKVAAAKAIASLVSDEELCPEYIIPKPFDERVAKVVAQAVKDAAK